MVSRLARIVTTCGVQVEKATRIYSALRFNKLGQPSDTSVDRSSTLSFERIKGIDIDWVEVDPDELLL